MKVKCPYIIIGGKSKCKLDMPCPASADAFCMVEATVADLLAALKALRPDCGKCKYEHTGVFDCMNCIWKGKMENNFTPKQEGK